MHDVAVARCTNITHGEFITNAFLADGSQM